MVRCLLYIGDTILYKESAPKIIAEELEMELFA